ncbi:AAA domain-containing protein, partial [Pterulicium gracile]
MSWLASEHQQVVLILVGLIASGKSTFASALEQHYPDFWKRCNQDDLGGDRRRVEQLARESLSQGYSICIDRTNFNAGQRAYWISIAREFPNVDVWVIVFDTPYQVCQSRLQHRQSHPTIRSVEQGLAVLSRFANDYRPPQPREGYQRIVYLKPSDHPSSVYTFESLSEILRRVRTSSIPNSSRTSSGYQGRGPRHSALPTTGTVPSHSPRPTTMEYNRISSLYSWRQQGQAHSMGTGQSSSQQEEKRPSPSDV